MPGALKTSRLLYVPLQQPYQDTHPETSISPWSSNPVANRNGSPLVPKVCVAMSAQVLPSSRQRLTPHSSTPRNPFDPRGCAFEEPTRISRRTTALPRGPSPGGLTKTRYPGGVRVPLPSSLAHTGSRCQPEGTSNCGGLVSEVAGEKRLQPAGFSGTQVARWDGAGGDT